MRIKRNIFLVDDNTAFCHATSTFLGTYGYQVRTYNTTNLLLEDIDFLTEGILLLGLRMPGMSGPKLHAELKNRNIALPIIYITEYGNVKLSVLAMKAGAINFLEKPLSNDRLLESIKEAFMHADEKYLHHKKATIIRNRFTTLTNREKEVLHCLMSGISNKQTAELLCISRRTVEVHRFNIMKKMKCDSLADLVRKSDLCSKANCTYYPESGDSICLHEEYFNEYSQLSMVSNQSM